MRSDLGERLRQKNTSINAQTPENKLASAAHLQICFFFLISFFKSQCRYLNKLNNSI